MRSVEVPEDVGKAGLLQFFVETREFRVIKVETADRGKDGEHGIAGRSCSGESSSIQEHAGCTFASLGEQGSDSGAAGKAGEIQAAIVDGKTRVCVLQHGLGRFGFHFPRAVSRVVRSDHDVTVAFGGILHEFHRNASATVRIEGIHDRPRFVRSIV